MYLVYGHAPDVPVDPKKRTVLVRSNDVNLSLIDANHSQNAPQYLN